jgi:branched-chain amino acid transport system permease protein
MTLDWLLAAGGAALLALVAVSALWHARATVPRTRLAATGAGWLALLGALILLDFSVPQLVNSYIWQIIIKIGIYITLAVSLNIINGIAGQFSMGHAGFMAVGAYTAAYLTMALGAGVTGWARWLPWNAPWSAVAAALGSHHPGAGSPLLAQAAHGLATGLLFLIALLAGGLAAAAAGYLVGIPSLRLRGDYLAIVTLGFGEIMRNIIANINVIGASRGLPGVPHYSSLFWVFLWAALVIFVSYRLLATAPGRAMLAVREDEVAAAAMGIDTTRTKIQAFAIGTFFAGVAGGLLGHHFEYLHPDYFKFDKSFEVIIMVVLGGMGSVSGATVAAILIALAPEVLRYAKDLLGNLTEPSVLYVAAPFILFALIFLALAAADIARILARSAASLTTALRMRAGGRLSVTDLDRLRRGAARSCVSILPRTVGLAPLPVHDAGVGAVIGLLLGAAHRAFFGATVDPRAEYWAVTIVGLILGGVIGRRRAARGGPGGSGDGRSLPAPPTTVRASAPPLSRVAAVGLLAPVAFAAAYLLEVRAPGFLGQVSVFFQGFPDPRMVLYSIMLVALMLVRPTGLFGTSEIWVWWRERRAARAGGRIS